jgi:F0F1-type ATP synthase assembly protein I
MNENGPESRQGEVVREVLTQGTALGTQAGCAGVVLIIGALLIGRWLDGQLSTGPWFSLGLLALSIPLSLYVMVRLVLRGSARRPQSDTSQEKKTDHGELR